ncbi:hypothetical protein G9A89_006689 [Geosiphon pyriformis]|nr:hypothetical protein G9A89_006689 [Geosiphon pyriformis]
MGKMNSQTFVWKPCAFLSTSFILILYLTWVSGVKEISLDGKDVSKTSGIKIFSLNQPQHKECTSLQDPSLVSKTYLTRDSLTRSIVGRNYLRKKERAYPKKIRNWTPSKINFLHKMAKYANMAYCGDDTDQEVKLKDVEVNVLQEPLTKNIFVIFKGNRLTRNQWEKREIRLSRYANSLHGKDTFVDAVWNADVNEFLPELISRIERFLSTKPEVPNGRTFGVTKIYSIGHGIGGAYAVLATPAIYKNLRTYQSNTPNQRILVSIVTFGQPRVGLSAFASTMNREIFIYRVTHTNDFIPRDFLSNFEFQHHEYEYWIARPDCDCKSSDINQTLKPMPDGNLLWECPGYRTSRNLTSGENLECNAGTTDSGSSQPDPHDGPYFGVTMDPLVDFKALKVTKKHFKRISLVATQIEDEESKVPVNDVAILDYLKEMASYSREAYCLSAEKTYFPQEITCEEKVITKHLHRLMVFIKGKKGSPTDRRRRINHLSLYPDTNNNIRAGVDSEWFRNYLYREAEINVKIDSAMNNYDVLYQVVFTGHGEGGVYAILAGLSFQRRHPTMRPYTNLVTYGAPRPGDRAFANHISAMFPEHLRVVNNNDWFPHMPTKAEKYQHPKTEYWISNANCNCGEVNDMADYILYKCLPEARGEDGFFIDENQNCHAGTTLIDSPLSQASHIGPYFGIQMNCSTMKDSMFKE